MKIKRTLFCSALLAACVALTSATYAQDANDQSLGDVVRKDQAKAKAKAKVTLDEDNTRPAPPAATESAGDASSKPDAGAPGSDPNAAGGSSQSAQQQPSPQERIQQIDQQENNIKAGLDVLQDKIDHSDSDQDTKDIWRNALVHGREQLDELDKEKQALQSQSGAESPQAPAPAQQPASNPQQ